MKNFLQQHGISWSSVIFALRTTIASLIALYIALAINLDSPKWAPMTVWIVAQHSRGMSLSKGQYRVAGTCIGAIIALALIGAFAQTPEIFALALATWVGVCTSLSTATFNFRSYGAVLAGYTTAIISLDAIAQPEHVFNIAVARTLDIIIGIVIEGIGAAIFSRESSPDDLRKQFSSFGKQCLELCTSILRGRKENSVMLHKQFSTALSLEAALTFATLESSQIRARSANFHAFLFSSLNLLAYSYNIDTHYTPPYRKAARARWLTLLKKWRTHKKAMINHSPTANLRYAGFALHIDRTAIFHNGLRSFFSMLAAMFIWIYSAGSLGAGFVTIVAVVCSLFATRSNAVAGSLLFFKGAVCAAIASAICNFWLLPLTSEFEMMALFLCGFLLFAGMLMRHPSVAGGAASFAIFFWDLINPQNAERMSPDHFFNGAITLLLGMACATLIFLLLFPPTADALRRRIHNAVRRDLMGLGSHPQKMTQDTWLSKCTGRLGHESALDHKYRSEDAETDFSGMMAAWMIGDAALELRKISERFPTLKKANRAVFHALSTGDPVILADVCKLSETLLLEETQELSEEEKQLLQNSTILLETIYLAVTNHNSFLASSHRPRAKLFLT